MVLKERARIKFQYFFFINVAVKVFIFVKSILKENFYLNYT